MVSIHNFDFSIILQNKITTASTNQLIFKKDVTLSEIAKSFQLLAPHSFFIYISNSKGEMNKQKCMLINNEDGNFERGK